MARKKKAIPATEPSLFPGQPPAPPQPAVWTLVTNHRNLCYMLAAGMVLPPRGFGRKYYDDPLGLRPGWIPLFRGAPPAAAVDQSVREGRGSLPCIARLSLAGFSGPAFAIAADGTGRDILLPSADSEHAALLLLPAPLPTAWITELCFRSRRESDECRLYATSMDNVPVGDFTLRVEPEGFAGDSGPPWPPQLPGLADFDRSADVPLAYGAALALFARFADRADRCIEIADLAFDPDHEPSRPASRGLLAPLRSWCAAGRAGETDDASAAVFWAAVDAVAGARSGDPPREPVAILLDCIQSRARGLEPRLAEPLLRLAADLRDITGFGDLTISEIFERHPKPFSRVMAMFCLRDTCLDLTRFHHAALSNDDYLNAAVLFAARDGWVGLPLELRNLPGLPHAVSHRMAALAQRMAGTGARLGDPPPRPRSVRERFVVTGSGWTARQQAAALDLARHMGWDCIRTTISLGKGDYRLKIDAKGVRLEVAGEVAAVRPEVDPAAFLRQLAQEPLDPADQLRLNRNLGD